jgi:transposase InsO family protein
MLTSSTRPVTSTPTTPRSDTASSPMNSRAAGSPARTGLPGCAARGDLVVFAKKPGLTRKAGPPVHDDLVDRQVTAHGANQVWLTDITEHRTDEGKLYLCAIKGYRDRWAVSGRAVTMQRWSPSSLCCNATFLDRQRWSTRAQLRLAIVTWIEKTYDRKRRQRRLGRLTPIEFETINSVASAA